MKNSALRIIDILSNRISRFIDKHIKCNSKYIIVKRSKYNRAVSEYKYAVSIGSAYLNKIFSLERRLRIKDVEIKFLKNKINDMAKKAEEEKKDFETGYTIIAKQDRRGKDIYYRKMNKTGKLSRVSKEEAIAYYENF